MLLVRAAILDDARADDAWERWCDGASQETIHSGEVRLLAAAYKGLERRGAGGPMVEVARGIYRRTWYVNQLAVARNAEIVTRLGEAGVPVLILKGFALAVLDYDDLGARPMEDLDLLVPPDRLTDAVRALEPLGYSPPGGPGPGSLLGKEVEVRRGDREVVEIHAYSLVESADDGDLWAGREGFALREVEAFAPGAADHLLLICAHGQRWNAVQPVSWVVDAATIVRASGAGLDWGRFVDRARARRLTLVAARAVGMLGSLEIEIPDFVLPALGADEAGTERELADRAARAAPTRLSSAVVGWDRYRRFRLLAPPELRPSGPLDWVADRWGVAGGKGLLSEAGRRALALGAGARSTWAAKGRGVARCVSRWGPTDDPPAATLAVSGHVHHRPGDERYVDPDEELGASRVPTRRDRRRGS